MRRRSLLQTMLAGLAAALLPRAGAAVGHDDPVCEMLWLVDAARRAANLLPLGPDPLLASLAAGQAAHMRTAERATHLGADGADPARRACHAGYSGIVAGEVLAVTRAGPEEVLAVWLEHEATRAVLLDEEASAVGMGAVPAADGRVWWNVVLGAGAGRA